MKLKTNSIKLTPGILSVMLVIFSTLFFVVSCDQENEVAPAKKNTPAANTVTPSSSARCATSCGTTLNGNMSGGNPAQGIPSPAGYYSSGQTINLCDTPAGETINISCLGLNANHRFEVYEVGAASPFQTLMTSAGVFGTLSFSTNGPNKQYTLKVYRYQSMAYYTIYTASINCN